MFFLLCYFFWLGSKHWDGVMLIDRVKTGLYDMHVDLLYYLCVKRREKKRVMYIHNVVL